MIDAEGRAWTRNGEALAWCLGMLLLGFFLGWEQGHNHKELPTVEVKSGLERLEFTVGNEPCGCAAKTCAMPCTTCCEPHSCSMTADPSASEVHTAAAWEIPSGSAPCDECGGRVDFTASDHPLELTVYGHEGQVVWRGHRECFWKNVQRTEAKER